MSASAKIFAFAALLGMAFAAPAFARDTVFVAKLAQPVAEGAQVIADQTLWTCAGDTCRAMPRHDVTVRACRQFVREAGAVTAYGPEDAQLSAEELERCNANARTTTQQQARN